MNRFRFVALLLFLLIAAPLVAQGSEIQNGQKIKNLTGQVLGGPTSADSVQHVLGTTASGTGFGSLWTDDQKRDRDFGALIPSGLNTVPTLAPGNAVQTPLGLDLHQYSHLKLLLTWNFASVADSDSVNIAVSLYGKTSSSMGDGLNAQLFVKVGTNAVADTARLWNPSSVNAIARGFLPPTYYVTRNTATGLNVFGTGYNYAASAIAALSPRWYWTGVGSCVINLGDLVDGSEATPYMGMTIANWNVSKTITNLTATFIGSR